MVEAEKYKSGFFDEMDINSLRSAKVVLPLVNNMLHPRSVVDVGCGTGVWLNTWQKLFELENYLGIDGPYIKPAMLKIPLEKFISKDLKEPLKLNKKFDLVMSLEVAEHLPHEGSGEFVNSLTALGDLILFSAALPGQTGTYHINEQYPEFWAAQFLKKGFIAVDCVRPNIWNHVDVEFYYQQNTIMFVRETRLQDFPQLKELALNTNPNYLTRIHPFLFELKLRQINLTKTFWGYINWRWYQFKRRYIYKDPSLNGA